MRGQLLVNSLKLAATLTAPGIARLFVEHELRAWAIPADVVADAKVIVSELVTNSVQFTGCARPNPTHADLAHVALLAVHVRVQGRSLFVEVWDNGEESKYPPPIRDEDECGRGLSIVSSLAVNMGHDSQADGELVWAELDIGPEVEEVPQVEPTPVNINDHQVIASLDDVRRADRALMGRCATVGGRACPADSPLGGPDDHGSVRRAASSPRLPVPEQENGGTGKRAGRARAADLDRRALDELQGVRVT